MSRSTRLLAILFTAQVSFMAFVYLFQDRWEHIQQQGVILGNIEAPITATASNQQNDQNQKVLVPERCGKRNSLRNLFD
ncbi:hypothetical protein OIU74_006401 [Salix koriyanagi]|uniref:Uncharacterized protein n=2 Tax=Salix TaxID=40685 RepID=A0A9Q0UE70_9ROSI|nr:hypothetical protein OIU74_006401 [Salix koriyanagi]